MSSWPDGVTNWTRDNPDRPVLFAGRHEIDESELRVITDPLPRSILALTPSHWIVADPWLFPAEHLTTRQQDAPIDVILTEKLDVPDAVRTLQHGLLNTLGPYDSIVCDSPMWDRLVEVFGWNRSQWVQPASSFQETIDTLQRQVHVTSGLDEPIGSPEVQDASARTQANKGRLRAEAEVLVPLFEQARVEVAEGAQANFVEVGSDTGRYVQLLRPGISSPLGANNLVSLRVLPAVAEQLRLNQPDLEVVTVGAETATTLSPDSIDLAFMSLNEFALDPRQRTTIQRRIVESLRVGGSLVTLHRLDSEPRVSLSERLEALGEVVGPQLVKDSLISIRDPQTGRANTAVSAFKKVGVPHQW